jgi:hypothetical protein
LIEKSSDNQNKKAGMQPAFFYILKLTFISNYAFLGILSKTKASTRPTTANTAVG